MEIIKRWMAFLLLFILTITSCVAQPHPASREPVTLTKLQSAQAIFDQLARGKEQAWRESGVQGVTDFFTADAVARDRTFGDNMVGPDQIAGLIALASAFGPDWESRLVDQYIGLENGLTVDELWNLKFGNNSYTQAHPMIEVDWLLTRDDRISDWTIFYSFDDIKDVGAATPDRLDRASSLLSSYQSAWSSGDAQSVAQLYASDAIREDMVFMERQEGQKAISTFAKTFFSWYPGAQWNLSLAFGEGVGNTPITGGIYTVQVSDQQGQPCAVKVAVVLQTSGNLITHETLYYTPQSLISCGWAR